MDDNLFSFLKHFLETASFSDLLNIVILFSLIFFYRLTASLFETVSTNSGVLKKERNDFAETLDRLNDFTERVLALKDDLYNAKIENMKMVYRLRMYEIIIKNQQRQINELKRNILELKARIRKQAT